MTEACTNVVLHAYDGQKAPDATFELSARVEEGELLVSVSDQGLGTSAPLVPIAGWAWGCGLPFSWPAACIRATRRAGLGTRLTMRFPLPE